MFVLLWMCGCLNPWPATTGANSWRAFCEGSTSQRGQQPQFMKAITAQMATVRNWKSKQVVKKKKTAYVKRTVYTLKKKQWVVHACSVSGCVCTSYVCSSGRTVEGYVQNRSGHSSNAIRSQVRWHRQKQRSEHVSHSKRTWCDQGNSIFCVKSHMKRWNNQLGPNRTLHVYIYIHIYVDTYGYAWTHMNT